jgi:hypothetical protein
VAEVKFEVGDKVVTANGLKDIESGRLMNGERGVVENVIERQSCFGTATTLVYNVRLENGKSLQMVNGGWLERACHE